jgi:hypothetical protein
VFCEIKVLAMSKWGWGELCGTERGRARKKGVAQNVSGWAGRDCAIFERQKDGFEKALKEVKKRRAGEEKDEEAG